MITGYNTDIKHDDRVYHVQTEDKGTSNPTIESLVYVGGEILASHKQSYADRLEEGADENAIADLMELQHKTMIAAIKRGRFDKKLQRKLGLVDDEVPAHTVAQITEDEPVVSNKSLDQVILDYLASEAESEHLELGISSDIEFVSGRPFDLRVSALRSLSRKPIQGASVEVKLISTVEPPRVLFRGETDESGEASVRATIPPLGDGTAAIIVAAQSDLGNDEVKQLVKKSR